MGATVRPIASVIRLADGRDLGYCEFGDPGGIPVIGFHGTPGSRLQLSPTTTSPLPAGYRLISPDRPGYGFSTFYKQRRLVDWPRDVEALADHLGLDRFAVLGISGGGPHVLVCAYTLSKRLIGVACVSGVGPLTDPLATEGMLALNRWITTLSRRAPWLVRALFRLQTRYLVRNPERALDMMTRQLPEFDRKILAASEFRALLIDDFAHSSHTAPFAAAQDFQLFSRDWGFRLEDIPMHVHYWQGSVDRNVPAHHADLLVSRTPHATLHRYEGEGHFLIVPRLAEILRTIAPR